MVKSIEEMIKEIQSRVADFEVAQAHAEADGTSDYDYYEGLLDAYGVTLEMLKQIIKENANG